MENTPSDVSSSVMTSLPRPSAPMGIFTSSYLAQGAFVAVRAAVLGVQAQQKLLAGQSLPTTSETFALLQELGTILQIDIVDVLNRASNRGIALNEYIASLKAVGSVAQRKIAELEVQKKTLEAKREQEKDALRDFESELRKVFREEDYGRAASLQEQSTKAGAALAETESQISQTTDVLDRFDELLDIAKERLTAIEGNREVLIAGLRVVDLPGIENLDILGEGKSFKKRSTTRSEAEKDIFGTRYIQDL